MEQLVRPLPVDRLTELVICLSEAGPDDAREAVVDAIERHGDWGDGLLNVAEALVNLRNASSSDARSGERSRVGASV